MTLRDANDHGHAEGCEAIHEGHAAVGFGVLAVGVSSGDVLAEGIEAATLVPPSGCGRGIRSPLPERTSVIPRATWLASRLRRSG